MTAQFPLTTSARGSGPRIYPRRTQSDAPIVALCWLFAVGGLAGSYWLPPLALQAASCLAGLAGATAAILMMIIGNRG